MLGNFSCFCYRLLTFFKINFFEKFHLGTLLYGLQMVWTKIRTDIMSVLIWVQSICKGYQQMTKVAASKERVNPLHVWYYLSTAFLLKNYIFAKNSIRNVISVKQFWIQIRLDVLSGLIWIQTVCKGYQQKMLAGKESNLCFISLSWIYCKEASH